MKIKTIITAALALVVSTACSGAKQEKAMSLLDKIRKQNIFLSEENTMKKIFNLFTKIIEIILFSLKLLNKNEGK